MLGGIVGYFLEIIWYFIRHHFWLIKNGVVFGGFQPIYGFGLVLITLLLYYFKDRKLIYLVFFGALIGFCFEYGASLFQEYILGTYTWTYKRFGFLAINGRAYIPYCFAWSLMGVIWIKLILDYFLKLIRKIPKKLNLFLVSILFAFMTFNLLFSTYVAYRKTARYNNIAPHNFIEKFIDKNYGDEFIDKRFPNLWVCK